MVWGGIRGGGAEGWVDVRAKSPDDSLGGPRENTTCGDVFPYRIIRVVWFSANLLAYDISRARPVGFEWKNDVGVGLPIGSS